MIFVTEIEAIDPKDGELKTWSGPKINAISYAMAEEYCQRNGLGYLNVTGILISEIDYGSNCRQDFDIENN